MDIEKKDNKNTGILVIVSSICDEYGTDLNICFKIFPKNQEKEAREWIEDTKEGNSREYIDTDFDIFSEVEPDNLLY